MRRRTTIPWTLLRLGLALGLGAGCGDDDDSIDADADADADADSDADADADSDADSDTDSDADSDADADADADADSDSDADADGDGDVEGTCGLPLALELDVATSGDTTDLPPAGDPGCGFGVGQPAAAYHLDSAAGVLVVEADPVDADHDGFGDWDLVLSLRSDCDDPSSEIACNASLPDDASLSRAVLCVNGDDGRSVIVSGAGDAETEVQAGAFTISATLAQPCEADEICVDGTGCVLDLPGGEVCNEATPVPLGSAVGDSTVAAVDDYQTLCGGDGGDVVYSLDVAADSQLTVDFRPIVGYGGALSIRSDCDLQSTELLCQDFSGRSSVCVGEGTWSLIVDGEAREFDGSAATGAFSLSATLDECGPEEVCRAGLGCLQELDGGETCGEAVPLPDLDGRYGGTTLGAANDTAPSCHDGAGGDVTYSFSTATAGLISLSVNPANGGAVSMSLRDGCVAESSELVCGDVFQCIVPGDYIVVVDGQSNGWGAPTEDDFVLSSSFHACGAGQRCTTSFGGPCVSDLSGGDSCGDAVPLPLGQRVGGSTQGLSNDGSLSCLTGESGGDAVYGIEVPFDGRLTWEVAAAGFPVAASLRETCEDDATELGCAGFSGPTCVSAGSYSLVVDGSDGGLGGQRSGDYTLLASFAPCDAGQTCVSGACIYPPIDEDEPNDDGDAAQTVEDAQTIEGTLPADDVDYFAIDLLEGETATFDFTGCTADTIAFVYADPLPDPPPPDTLCDAVDPAPALACDDDTVGLCSLLEVTAPEDGRYYVRVIGATTGGYLLTITVD